MANLLQNPKMGNWQHVRYLTDRQGKVVTIEAPARWEYVSIPREDDPHRIPESLHRDDGFVISASYLAWEAGYKQHDIIVQAGQRYRLRATLKADVNFPGGQAPDLSAITWRFTVESAKGNLQQDWAMTTRGETKQIEDAEYVFEAHETATVDVTFWGRSFYAGNDCDFWVYEILLEPVAEEYGGEKVPAIGARQTGEAKPLGEVDPFTTERIPTSEVREIIGPTGKSLGDVLTAAEIDVIATGLRAWAASAPTTQASEAFYKLAEAFERLK